MLLWHLHLCQPIFILPAMPSMQADLGGRAELTVTGFVIGFALVNISRLLAISTSPAFIFSVILAIMGVTHSFGLLGIVIPMFWYSV